MQKLQQLLFLVLLAGIVVGCGSPPADPSAADNKKNVGKPNLVAPGADGTEAPGGASAGAVK